MRPVSPARGFGNESSGMRAVMDHPIVSARPRPVSPARNPVEKAVSQPCALSLQRKKKVEGVLRTNEIFVGPTASAANSARTSTFSQKRCQAHTDPFDGLRQSKPRPMYPSYGEIPHQQPHAAGKLHCAPIAAKASRGFLSVTGAVSYGGMRHTPLGASAESDHNASLKSPTTGKKCVSPQRSRSPIAGTILEGAVHQPLAHPHRRSPVRDRPTLEGVMYREPQPEPRGFSYRPPWHTNTPRGSQTTQSVSSVGKTATAKENVCGVALVMGSRAATTAQLPVKQFSSCKVAVRAPFHTDTPRANKSTPTSATRAPYAMD